MKYHQNILFLLCLLLSTLGYTRQASAAEPKPLIDTNFSDPQGKQWIQSVGKLVTHSSGERYVEIDSRPLKDAWWNTGIVIPASVFKAHTDYTVTIDYDAVALADPLCAYYLFARSETLGHYADLWTRWRAEPNTSGRQIVHLAIPDVDDMTLTIGVRGSGALRIRRIVIAEGIGLESAPVNKDMGIAPSAAPVAAQDEITIEPPKPTNTITLSAADFGLKPDRADSAANDNIAALQRAIDACRQQKAARLIVPKGIYYMKGDAPIQFSDMDNFTFDGQGSTFIFSSIGHQTGFAIANSHHAIFQNFQIDWDWSLHPLGAVAKVTNLSPNRATFELSFSRPEDAEPSKLNWRTMWALGPDNLPDRGVTAGTFKPQQIEKIGSGALRVHAPHELPLRVGKTYLIRNFTYDKHAVVMTNNQHLSFRDVSIYSFPGMGFLVNGDQEHWEFIHCGIGNKPGDTRPISATTDGLHINQSKGYFKLENCDFGHMGDDCINIKDNSSIGIQVKDDHTLIALNVIDWRTPFKAGDPVELRKNDLSPTGFQSPLIGAKFIPGNKAELTFRDPLPKDLTADTILFNRRYHSDHFSIRNCTFRDNQGRAILIQSSFGLVENCRFSKNSMSTIRIESGCDASWSEGFGVSNILFRGNQFEKGNRVFAEQGSYIYIGTYLPGARTAYPVIRNIRFEKNTFADAAGLTIYVSSCDQVEWIDNLFRNIAPDFCRAELASNLIFLHNQWTDTKGTPTPAVEFSPADTKNVILAGNQVHQP